MDQEERSNFQGFNPFTVGPDHDSHSESTAIINLEESGQVFCPLCLEKVSYRKIEKIRDELFERYVRGLFEALDQHGEKRYIRDIVLSILEIILGRRDLSITSDHDFHNLLRIIYKILSSEKFRLHEFPAVTRMFAAISRRFTSTNPIPLIAVSKAMETIIESAGKQLSKCLDENSHGLRSNVIKLLRSAFTTIRVYLELLGRFAVDRSSDVIFPLYESDDPQMHNRSFHKNYQVKCLSFTYQRLLPSTLRHLITVKNLDSLDGSLVLSLFETLRECFLSATRVGYNEFIDYINKEDCLLLAHRFSYKCLDADLRKVIKSFIRVYVLHYIEKKFEPDAAFRIFAAQHDTVETNHKNALLYSVDNSKSTKTIFYVMVNYVAYEQKSGYYNQDRLKKVIFEVNPALFYRPKSIEIIKVYLHATSIVTRNVSTVDSIEKFFRNLWKQIRDGIRENNFDDEFCSNERIFFWAHRHSTFKELITWRSIKHLIEIGSSQISIAHNTLKLLDDDFYKEQTVKYFENDRSSVKLIERFTGNIDGCEFHVGDRYHKPLMTKLGAIIPTLLYDAINKLTNSIENIENIAKTERLTRMILLWIDHCKQMDLLLDDDFITAWFRALDEITVRQSQNDERYQDLIIAFVEFICALIRTNHSQLINILARLNYTSLGVMYTWLKYFSIGDRLVESIANMIIAYDELDYPLEHNAVDGLLDMEPDPLYWMLSSNTDLHALSLRCAENTFLNQRNRITRAVVATGLIDMISRNSDIVTNIRHTDIMKLLFTEDEVLYNPLLTRLKGAIPASLATGYNETRETHVSPSLSPALSFVSEESNFLEEENISVIRILNQLQNEEAPDVDSSCTIPEGLFLSRTLTDRHINSVDTGDWERLASESNKNRVPSV